MGNPVKTIGTAITGGIATAFKPVQNAITRAFTPPGLGGPDPVAAPQAPPPPPQAGPPQSPTGTRGGTERMAKAQLSFLTAASKAAAAMGTGAATGKTLLGQ